MTETTTSAPVKTNEQYAAERIAKISSTKIYGDGTTPIPYGILDILFYEKDSQVTTRFNGNETSEGQVMFLLPFRTPRRLDKYATMAIPSTWKVKFKQGDQVYAIIADGYVQKLIPAGKLGNTSAVIRPQDALKNASVDAEKAFNTVPETAAPPVVVQAPVSAEGPTPEGFEPEDENPFN